MMPGKDFGRGVHVGMLVEESANVTSERPVVGLTGRIQRKRRLAVGMAYLLPARLAFGDKGWKLDLAPRNSHCLFVRAPVGIRHHATYPARQTCAEFNQRYARSGNPLSSRPSRGGLGSHAARAQLARKPFTETIELNRPGIEPKASNARLRPCCGQIGMSRSRHCHSGRMVLNPLP